MQSRIFKDMTITIERKGTHFDEQYRMYQYWYSVEISNSKGNAKFQFIDSNVNFKKNVEPNPFEALQCYISDAYCYVDTKDIDDFDDQFGSEENPIRKRIAAYEGCKKAYEDLLKMGYDSMDLSVLSQDIDTLLE